MHALCFFFYYFLLSLFYDDHRRRAIAVTEMTAPLPVRCCQKNTERERVSQRKEENGEKAFSITIFFFFLLLSLIMIKH